MKVNQYIEIINFGFVCEEEELNSWSGPDEGI